MVYGFNCHPQGLSTHQEVLNSISGLEGFVFEHINIYIYIYIYIYICIIFPLVKLAQCWLWVLRDPSEQTVIREINTH